MCGILMENMAFKIIHVAIVIIFIKAAICGKGYVRNMYNNKKFYCEGALKYTAIVTSPMQCIHHCLRKDCQLLNYIFREDGKVNCEVLSGTGQCLTVLDEENWMAISVEIEKPTVDIRSSLGYIGCYKDSTSRALSSTQALDVDLGELTEQCIGKCRQLNHPYAGLQNHKECYCGTTYDKYGKLEESLCNTLCNDSSGRICGGKWKSSVYKICLGKINCC